MYRQTESIVMCDLLDKETLETHATFNFFTLAKPGGRFIGYMDDSGYRS